jgi:hypothetical protein
MRTSCRGLAVASPEGLQTSPPNVQLSQNSLIPSRNSDQFERRLLRAPHRLVDLLYGVGQRLFGQAVHIGCLGHRDSDRGRNCPQVCHWWQQRPARASRIGERGNGVRSSGDHGVVDSPCPDDRYTEAEAREDQRVVGLSNGVRPPVVAGGWKGLPVATSARPSVHRIRSSGTASAFDVGLDSGMMTGRSTVDAICRTMSSVNAPDWVEVPISIVGFAFTTTSARVTGPPSRDQLTTSTAVRAYGFGSPAMRRSRR